MQKVALVGTFYPEPGAGTFLTGLAYILAKRVRSDGVVVFAQSEGRIPESWNSEKTTIHRCWSRSNPWSLMASFFALGRYTSKSDVLIFSLHLREFGESALGNALGLLLPVLASLYRRKPAVVYMHHFLETQESGDLGYEVSALDRLAVRAIEQLLLRFTHVVMPMASQSLTVETEFRTRPMSLFIPYLEAVGLQSMGDNKYVTRPPEDETAARILLLGTWGPQKDLEGVLASLSMAARSGAKFTVSISETTNLHFPVYRDRLRQSFSASQEGMYSLLGLVNDEDLLNVVSSHDLLILPYNATGGYSGSMVVGAYTGIEIIAYDLPQLRETARYLDINPVYIAKGDRRALAESIVTFCNRVSEFRRRRAGTPRPPRDSDAMRAIEQLLSLAR